MIGRIEWTVPQPPRKAVLLVQVEGLHPRDATPADIDAAGYVASGILDEVNGRLNAVLTERTTLERENADLKESAEKAERDSTDAWRRLGEDVCRLQSERDAFRRDLEAQLAGNLELRKQYGARDGETMFDFHARVHAELKEAKQGHSYMSSYMDQYRNECRTLREQLEKTERERDALQVAVRNIAETQRKKCADEWRAYHSGKYEESVREAILDVPLVTAEATERKPYREHARLLGILGMRAIRTEENADAIAAQLDRWDAKPAEQGELPRSVHLRSRLPGKIKPACEAMLPPGHQYGNFDEVTCELCRNQVTPNNEAKYRALDVSPPQPASEGEERPAWRDEPCDRTEGQCYDQRREKREAKARVAELESSLQSTRRELDEAKKRGDMYKRSVIAKDNRIDDDTETINRLRAALSSLRKVEQARLAGFARYLQEQGCSLGEMTEAELADAAATYRSTPQPEQPDTKAVCTPGNVGAYLVSRPEQAKEPTMSTTPKEMAQRAREMFMDPHFKSAADIVNEMWRMAGDTEEQSEQAKECNGCIVGARGSLDLSPIVGRVEDCPKHGTGRGE